MPCDSKGNRRVAEGGFHADRGLQNAMARLQNRAICPACFPDRWIALLFPRQRCAGTKIGYFSPASFLIAPNSGKPKALRHIGVLPSLRSSPQCRHSRTPAGAVARLVWFLASLVGDARLEPTSKGLGLAREGEQGRGRGTPGSCL